jgi:hypothetical protein
MDEGRALLERVIEQDPRNDRAWVWLSGCVEDAMQRRICLQQALAANPKNQAALDGMQALEGKLVQASDMRPSLLESRLSALGMGDRPAGSRPAPPPRMEAGAPAAPDYFAPVVEEDMEESAERPRRSRVLLLVGVVLLLFVVVCALVALFVLPPLLGL